MLHPPNLSIFDNMQLVFRAAACLGIIGVTSWVYLFKSKTGLPLPPSPPTWRLRGHFLPPRSQSLHAEFVISRFNILLQAVVDIMETQGKALADRPRAGEIFGGGISVAVAAFGVRFRRMRRALHTHLQPKAAETYQPLQMSHAKKTVLDILDDPCNFQNHVQTYAATTIMKVAYGKNAPTSATDPEVIEITEVVKMVNRMLHPGAYLVNSIPWLKYLPWYGQDVKRGFERGKKLNVGQLNRVKEQMQNNVDIGPSFAKYMLESSDRFGLTESEMAALPGAFFGAGSTTTSSAICTVLMAAACFPEEQATVQAELDAVIGRHRAPTFADQKSLPRLHAFISEALRWRPLVSNGLAHRTTKDVIWATGTTVFGNHWSISRDPEVYPEPYGFKPQRWIDDQGRLRDDLKFFAFGFGRRACPGQHVANRSVFINSLLIFWAFRLALDPTKPLDDMGYMNRELSKRPCEIVFETRIPETEIRRMMQNYPEVA
ncbi:cytochrome P450 [Suillus paluster]|uniref:cytochrome P450 n=1 Tax=Suillus paluster TaxID=48578 RepID=UPI001B863E8D|nr:cytochrome P450 [Suillus paluster]KAG1750446.1 cytochrome P450 [Suillus paluster]